MLLLVWTGLTAVLFYRWCYSGKESWQQLSLVIACELGLTSILILIEWTIWRWFLVVVGAVLIGWLLLQKSEPDSQEPAFIQKPIRRIKMMIWVFSCYTFLTLLFSFSLFFQQVSFWIFAVTGGMIAGFTTLMINKLYFAVPAKALALWSLLLGLMVVELMWVMSLLPLGYLLLGLITAWLWFLAQLFVRFHLGQGDIIWEKQKWFLLVNLFLLFLILFFFVRWI